MKNTFNKVIVGPRGNPGGALSATWTKRGLATKRTVSTLDDALTLIERKSKTKQIMKQRGAERQARRTEAEKAQQLVELDRARRIQNGTYKIKMPQFSIQQKELVD